MGYVNNTTWESTVQSALLRSIAAVLGYIGLSLIGIVFWAGME